MNSRNRSTAIFLCLFTFITLLNSCKKNDPDPVYVGTWSYEDTIVNGDTTMKVKEAMTFTKDSFTDMLQVYDQPTTKYLNYFEIQGSLSANGSLLTVTIKSLGVSSIDMITGNPTGVITMYESGTSGFESIFSQISQPRTFSMDYTVSGNVMTIRSDNNGDGDYSDAGEITQYTKE